MLSSDRTLSLVVAIETALEDRRYEASPLSCSCGSATVMDAAVLRLLLCQGLHVLALIGQRQHAPTCTAGGCTPKR